MLVEVTHRNWSQFLVVPGTQDLRIEPQCVRQILHVVLVNRAVPRQLRKEQVVRIQHEQPKIALEAGEQRHEALFISVGSDKASSTSLRNSRHGDGSSGDVAKDIRRPVGQKVPVLRVVGSILGKPASLRLAKDLAQGVFAGEAAPLELGLERPKSVRLVIILLPLGNATSKGDDETQTILEIAELRFSYKPCVIERRVSQDQPGKGLDHASFELLLGKRREKVLGWIPWLRLVRAQIGKAGIPEYSKVFC